MRDEHNAMTEGNFTVSLIDLDDITPVISLTGPTSVTHEAGTTYLDRGANWSDGDDGTGTITGNGEVSVRVPGTYTITYDKTDNAGNAPYGYSYSQCCGYSKTCYSAFGRYQYFYCCVADIH